MKVEDHAPSFLLKLFWIYYVSIRIFLNVCLLQFLVLAALLAVAAADSAYPAPAAYSAPAYNHKSYDYVSRSSKSNQVLYPN